MAITKIHPIKRNVTKAIKYIINPEKTDGSLLVDYFACSKESVDIEFLMNNSGGSGRGRNEAFHLIQSFAPGEVSEKEAHEIGVELANKLLQGRYSYVIATHIDTGIVHNHIMFCAVDNFDHKKYLDNKRSYWKLRHMSDDICREHGLSIIENPKCKGKSYNNWMENRDKESARSEDGNSKGNLWKEMLKDDILSCIEDADTYADFVRLMRHKDYEVEGEELPNGDEEHDKNIKESMLVRRSGFKKFVAVSEKYLGRGFCKEKIVTALDKKARLKAAGIISTEILLSDFRTVEEVARRAKPYDKLLDTSEDKYREKPGLKKWVEKKNLQTLAHAYADGGSLQELDEKLEETRKKIPSIRAEIVKNQRTMSELRELANYVKNRDAYGKYKKSYNNAKDKEAFLEKYESQLMMYDAAIRQISEKGLDPSQVTYEQVTEGIKQVEKEGKQLNNWLSNTIRRLGKMEAQKGMLQTYFQEEKDSSLDIDTADNIKNRNEEARN